MDPYERLRGLPRPGVPQPPGHRPRHAGAGSRGRTTPPGSTSQTAQSYGPLQPGGAPSGPPLFTDGEQQQQQTAAGGPGHPDHDQGHRRRPGGGARRPRPRPGRRRWRGRAAAGAAWVRRATDTPGAAGKYLAYDDLPGARYSPANTPSPRPAVVVQPAGLSLLPRRRRRQPPRARPADARRTRAAIDALDGTPWEQSVHAPAHVRAAARAGAVRGAGRRAGELVVGLLGLAQGRRRQDHPLHRQRRRGDLRRHPLRRGAAWCYVFKQVVHAIEEVAHAIGAFFVELAKAIEKVLRGPLAVLFDFGEIDQDPHHHQERSC